MRVASPAIASSTELSTTSHTRWWRPLGPVDPMNIPGRLRTGSRPSRTVMSLAAYELACGPFGGAFSSSSGMALMATRRDLSQEHRHRDLQGRIGGSF